MQDEAVCTVIPAVQRDVFRDVPSLMFLLPFVELAANQTRHNAYTSYIDLEDIIEEEEETLGEHGKDFSFPILPSFEFHI